MEHQPAETLKNRSYIGLILSQFLAAFNDQATHIVAIFFAVDMLVRFVHVEIPFSGRFLADKDVITIVTACFILPFLLFSPVAGPMADRYSKRSILIAWKLAEVGIMGAVLVGFLLPHTAAWGWLPPKTLAVLSSILVVSGVFLMGTHSTFFVPAKYGAMPEMLHHSILSRGNGLLEGTSFTANILGTMVGGLLYGELKSKVDAAGNLVPGREWLIGVILFGLAVVGAIGSFLIDHLPVAAKDKQIRFVENFRYMRKSRSLVVAVFGIAFFAFMTLFMRQVLLAEAEAEEEHHKQVQLLKQDQAASAKKIIKDEEEDETKPESPEVLAKHQSTELKVAMLIGLVGLGVGIGCASAGYLSGKKLELGLVLIGAPLLVFMLVGLAFAIKSPWTMSTCLVLVGVSAGLYIVPMYTMLQHRAPKGSKGNLVAASNFVNVAGGMLAIIVFWMMTVGLEAGFNLHLQPHRVAEQPELRPQLIDELEKRPTIAQIQFLGAAVITVAMIALLVKMRPDFLMRSVYWLRTFGRPQANPDGLHHIPGIGPVILLTNAGNADACLQLATFTDRFTRFVLPDGSHPGEPRLAMARRLATLVHVLEISKSDSTGMLSARATATLQAGHVLAIAVDRSRSVEEWTATIDSLRRETQAVVVPVACVQDATGDRQLHSITTGELLAVEAPRPDLQAAIVSLLA